MVYMPETKEFYRKDVIIRARKNELHIQEWPIKASKMNLDMQEPVKKFSIKDLPEGQEDTQVIDFSKFVFKDWFFDTSENVDKVFKHDFIGQDLNFEILSKIDSRIHGKTLQLWKF